VNWSSKADALPEAIAGSFRGVAEQALELGEGHLDRVHVGRIGQQRENEAPAAAIGQCLNSVF
jgi:hypothetical protein